MKFTLPLLALAVASSVVAAPSARGSGGGTPGILANINQATKSIKELKIKLQRLGPKSDYTKDINLAGSSSEITIGLTGAASIAEYDIDTASLPDADGATILKSVKDFTSQVEPVCKLLRKHSFQFALAGLGPVVSGFAATNKGALRNLRDGLEDASSDKYVKVFEKEFKYALNRYDICIYGFIKGGN